MTALVFPTILWFIAAFSSTACQGPRGSEPAGPSSTPLISEDLVYQVQSAQDLLHLRAEYQRLADDGYDGTITVRFSSDTDFGAGWDLWPQRGSPAMRRASTIDLVIQGQGGTLPGPLSRVRARNLTLEDLRITGSRSVPLTFQVSGTFSMSHCAVVDGRWTDPNGGEAYVLVQGRKGSDAFRVSIADSWFLRNWQNPPMPLLLVAPATQHGAIPQEVVVRRSAFLGNAFASEIIQGVRNPELRRELAAEIAGRLGEAVGNADSVEETP